MTLVETINAIIESRLDYAENNQDAVDAYSVLDGWDAEDTEIVAGSIYPPKSYIDCAPLGELEIQLPDSIESFFKRHPRAAEAVGRKIDGYLNLRTFLVYVNTDIVYYLV
jgi:hypothetical protein